jgi:hypothetical protein
MSPSSLAIPTSHGMSSECLFNRKLEIKDSSSEGLSTTGGKMTAGFESHSWNVQFLSIDFSLHCSIATTHIKVIHSFGDSLRINLPQTLNHGSEVGVADGTIHLIS